MIQLEKEHDLISQKPKHFLLTIGVTLHVEIQTLDTLSSKEYAFWGYFSLLDDRPYC